MNNAVGLSFLALGVALLVLGFLGLWSGSPAFFGVRGFSPWVIVAGAIAAATGVWFAFSSVRR